MILCDYYVVRRGYLSIRDLYNAGKNGAYYHFLGFSWHAYASYLAGILINIVGFAGEIGRNVPIGAQYIYKINYFSGVIVSATVYFILTRFFPIPRTSDKWNEVDIDEDELAVAYDQEVIAENTEDDGQTDRGSLSSKHRKVPTVGSKAV